jgi:peptidoglycan-associated lipoprotein
MAGGPSFLIWSNKTFRILRGSYKSCLQLGLVVLSVALLLGCPSKTPVARTPAPPPPPAPTATIAATPATAQPGQAVVISWKTENATDISIDPLGPVQGSGSTAVTPNGSTTYRLTAKGPGGVQEAHVRVTVVVSSAERPMNTSEGSLTAEEATRLDVFFDTNDYSIRPDQFVTIQNDAAFLKEHPDLRIVIEGHCDETGSAEYNLALGDRRAAEVENALEKAGVSPSRMRSISYGKEQQFCTDESDTCWRLNRRAHIVPDTQPEARAEGEVH